MSHQRIISYNNEPLFDEAKLTCRLKKEGNESKINPIPKNVGKKNKKLNPPERLPIKKKTAV